MSDFRCEWQALHGPRCSHQCNECKDNDTPPEPRMTSERLTKNGECPVCNTPIDASPAAAPRNEKSAADLMHAVQQTRAIKEKLEELHYTDKTTSGRDMLASALVGTRLIDYAASLEAVCVAAESLALRATPRAGSASKERGFFEWSCGCSLNNGLVTPCATHAPPAAAPREHPSPEPYCASCDAREGEPCPHNVIQCARPRRAHLPRAETDETREAVANAVLEAETKWRDKLAADAHQSVRTLGERLTELLDDDHWNNVEPLLLAVAAALAAHPPRAGEGTEEGMADAMMAFNGWDRDEDVTPETRAKLRAHYIGNGIGKRDAMYVAVQRAVTAALGRPS